MLISLCVDISDAIASHSYDIYSMHIKICLTFQCKTFIFLNGQLKFHHYLFVYFFLYFLSFFLQMNHDIKSLQKKITVMLIRLVVMNHRKLQCARNMACLFFTFALPPSLSFYIFFANVSTHEEAKKK